MSEITNFIAFEKTPIQVIRYTETGSPYKVYQMGWKIHRQQSSKFQLQYALVPRGYQWALVECESGAYICTIRTRSHELILNAIGAFEKRVIQSGLTLNEFQNHCEEISNSAQFETAQRWKNGTYRPDLMRIQQTGIIFPGFEGYDYQIR